MERMVEQPDEISISDTLILLKYYPCEEITLRWYQDPVLVKQVDNSEEPYTIEKLRRMYAYLCEKGECYYIHLKENDEWKLIGDVSLYEGKTAIVIAKEYQNRHIGRLVIHAMAERAGSLGWKELGAEIYSFNVQSQKAFKAAGFEHISGDWYAKVL